MSRVEGSNVPFSLQGISGAYKDLGTQNIFTTTQVDKQKKETQQSVGASVFGVPQREPRFLGHPMGYSAPPQIGNHPLISRNGLNFKYPVPGQLADFKE